MQRTIPGRGRQLRPADPKQDSIVVTRGRESVHGGRAGTTLATATAPVNASGTASHSYNAGKSRAFRNHLTHHAPALCSERDTNR